MILGEKFPASKDMDVNVTKEKKSKTKHALLQRRRSHSPDPPQGNLVLSKPSNSSPTTNSWKSPLNPSASAKKVPCKPTAAPRRWQENPRQPRKLPR